MSTHASRKASPASAERMRALDRKYFTPNAAYKMPLPEFSAYRNAKSGTPADGYSGNRKAAAQVLRDYRSTLGRDRPSSLATAKGFAQKAEVVVREGAKMVAKRQPLSSPHWAFGIGAAAIGAAAAQKGYMFDGVRGAARGIVSTATFGLGTPVFNAMFGDGSDNVGHFLDVLGSPRNRAEAVQKRVADHVNNRPTRAGADYLHKTAQAPKPQSLPDPTKHRDTAHAVASLGAGAVGTVAAPYLMTKMGEGIVRGATAVARNAPAIGGAIARAVPRGPVGMAIAVGVAAAGAIASSGGAKAAPAAPQADSGKSRTDPYVTKDGRQYRNGRLIVRPST